MTAESTAYSYKDALRAAEPGIFLLKFLITRFFDSADIKTIFELGARDCRETLAFHALYPDAEIYTFECNPGTIPLCRQTIDGLDRIHLTEAAVSNKEGTVDFFQIDTSRTRTAWKDGNPGASSLLEATGLYPEETYVQNKISVPSLRLQDFIKKKGIGAIDILWMDIQGAELLALQGLGDDCTRVGLIFTEAWFFPAYKNAPSFSTLKSFLNKKGFLFYGFANYSAYFGDAIFVHQSRIRYRSVRLQLYFRNCFAYPFFRLLQQRSLKKFLLRWA